MRVTVELPEFACRKEERGSLVLPTKGSANYAKRNCIREQLLSKFLWTLGGVHLQLDTDTFIPLKRCDDTKEVLSARIPTWPEHPLQAGRGDLCFTGKFTKTYRCIDVVAQDSTACSKVAAVDELESFAKKTLAKRGFTLCAFADRIAKISCKCHGQSSYLRFVVLLFAAVFASACFLTCLYSRQAALASSIS
jgi:hypothetical protein